MSARADLGAAELMAAGLRALRRHEETTNALNVFPVPDGDTGTNLAMTMQAVTEQLASVSAGSLADHLKAISLGSLMGARGNSGVILSQIIRGVCESLESVETIDAVSVAEALENGVKVAYQAIRKPVEGTMLTVMRDAASAARQAVNAGEADVAAVLDIAVREAGASVARTPELLPVLREAGVVDAGGYGLAAIGDGMVAAVLGRTEQVADWVGPVGIALVSEEHDLEHRYCTEFVIHAGNLDAGSAEDFLSSVGGSIMVAASPELARIHVHTNRPGLVIDWATAQGGVDRVKINDMAAQVAERARVEAEVNAPADGVGVVAVANGRGVVEILQSLGVSRVVDGGQTMNPSAAELAAAAEAIAQESIIVLPNNGNIIMAAQQAQHLSSKKVAVVPTKTIPEAFAALLVFDAHAPIDENEQAMSDAADSVKTCEITHAVRSGKAGDLKFRKGDLIGIRDGEICVVGHKLAATAMRMVDESVENTDAAVTLLVGEGADPEQIEKIEAKLKKRFPRMDVDVQHGGQPLYPLIVGIE